MSTYKLPLVLKQSTVRIFLPEDAESISRYANNINIWRQLRDAFPYPYQLRDAVDFINNARKQTPATHYAIEVNGKASGAIGLILNRDIERYSAEIGYWLAEEYWGHGIVTEVLQSTTLYAIKRFHLKRVYALSFCDNIGSVRVLEKAGYKREGRLSQNAFKDGAFRDQYIYAYIDRS